MIFCWIAIFSYCVPAIIAGPSGILETRNALASADWMRDNLENLSDKNSIFNHELDDLHTLPEPIALEARSLGYVAHNEIVVRMSSAQPIQVFSANPGQLVIYKKDPSLQDVEIKGIAIAMTIITGLTILVLKLFASRKWRPDHRASLAHDASRA